MRPDLWESVSRAFAVIVVASALAGAGPASVGAQQAQGTYEASESGYSVMARVDVSCIFRNWMILGGMVCVKGYEVRACLIYQNPYPVGIVESVRQTGGSHLAEGAAYLKGLTKLPLFGQTSSHTPHQGAGSGLQFGESHAFEFIPDLKIGDYMIAKPDGTNQATPAYFSEVDGLMWRSAELNYAVQPLELAKKVVSCAQVPRLSDCAGAWGPWFPYLGFITNSNEVIASNTTALRAARVANAPVARVTVGRYTYQPRTGHFFQPIRPVWKPCFSIGSAFVKPIEAGSLSQEGAYLLIHFGVFVECEG